MEQAHLPRLLLHRSADVPRGAARPHLHRRISGRIHDDSKYAAKLDREAIGHTANALSASSWRLNDMRLAPVAGLGLAALVMALAACDSGSNGLQTAPIASTLAQEPRGDQSASAVPRRLPGTSQLTAQLLHSFRHNGDGFFPAATLLKVDGTL